MKAVVMSGWTFGIARPTQKWLVGLPAATYAHFILWSGGLFWEVRFASLPSPHLPICNLLLPGQKETCLFIALHQAVQKRSESGAPPCHWFVPLRMARECYWSTARPWFRHSISFGHSAISPPPVRQTTKLGRESDSPSPLSDVHLGLRPEQPPLPYWILRGAVWALGFGHPLFAWNLRGRPKPGAVEACNTDGIFARRSDRYTR